MMIVGLKVRTIDQDVVEVNYNAVVKKRVENIIDKSLECGRDVGEAERYHSKFVVTVACTKSRLWYVFVLDMDLVIAGAEVEFREYLCALNSVKDLINTKERVLIFDGQFVQCPIV